MPDTKNTTLVVMNAGGTALEPYDGIRAGDSTVVFARHPDETALHLDMRLRANLVRYKEDGTRPLQAVLVWRGDETNRDILRRTELVARYLPPGAQLSLATESADSFELASLEGLAVALRQRLEQAHVTINVFCHTSLTEPESEAPMTAAWRRLQQRRQRQSDPAAAPLQSEVMSLRGGYERAI